jgi:DNA primase
VFAAGIPNVIASSGTAFTEPQARLLARFSRNIIVNFDPDTAGANAAERSLALLVEEEFQIKVLTLDAGFDPDLFIRNKGRDAYIAALRSAPKYFDYLIARAQSQFPVRTPEGKVKAVNFLLPHVQRVQSRIVRNELAGEIAQRLGIDSAVLRQELKSAATNRSAVQVKTYSSLNRAEKIFIIAVAGDAPLLQFDPAIARDRLRRTRLHDRTSIASIIDALIQSEGDLIAASLKDPERALVAEVLLKRNEEVAVSLELFEQVCSGVLRGELLSRQRDLHERMKSAKRLNDTAAVERLRREKIDLDRQIRDIGGPPAPPPA